MKSHCLWLAVGLLVPAGAALADGDAVAGMKIFKVCAPCHTATEPLSKVGPSLMGIVGRPVATFEGYKYSKAMREFGADGKVWSEDLLAEYLPAPKALVPGTIMTFAGMKKAEDIAKLIAYLKDPAATN